MKIHFISMAYRHVERQVRQTPRGEMNEQILIEAISPSVEEGRYPARVIAGRPCVVEADIFTSGLDRLRAVVRWRRTGGRRGQEVPAAPLGNDRWRAEFPLAAPARYTS